MSDTWPPQGPQGDGSPEPLRWGPQSPAPGAPPEQRGGGRRKGYLLGAGAVLLVVALGGGGVWAATTWFGTGSQPAEALPGDALAYVAVDLDPSGGQKLEALRTLEKFPVFTDNTDVDADTDADLKEAFFDGLQDAGAECAGLDYTDDLSGWLGDRAAIGVLPGDDEPDVVGVVQVSDADAAEDGLQKIANCGDTQDSDVAGEDGGFGYVVQGDWAVVAEDDSIAQAAVGAAGEGTLADDEDYDRWTDAAGDPGVLAAYAAPSLADELGDELDQAPSGIADAFDDFEGAAVTVRFADEGVEVESAGYNGVSGSEGLFAPQNVEDSVTDLPDDTAAVFALGFEEGWGDDLLGLISDFSGLSADDLAAEAEEELGIAVPQDLETLLGEGAAVTVSEDLDLEGLEDGSTPPEEALVGLRIRTDDPDASEEVLDELRGSLPDDELVVSETGDGLLAVSPNEDYLSSLVEGGDLGGQDAFADAVPEADRSGALLYVDLDVIDDYGDVIDGLTGDPRVAENLEPLAAVGLTSWVDDDVPHSLLRLSTDAD